MSGAVEFNRVASTAVSARAAAGPARQRIVLASDLDGTFVGGSQQQRDALYSWIREHRDELVLLFVSGRGQQHMRELARDIELEPDGYIGDVGTSVAAGAPRSGGLAPQRWHDALVAVERWLGDAWPTHAAARIGELMRRHDRLRAQPVVGGRRKSYYYDDEAAALRAAGELRSIGFDVLMSDDRYFDVLPRGVQKGPTLLRLLHALGLPAQRTLVAGDTLNDLSMFRAGFGGVAVSNREPALERALQGAVHVHLSRLPGAAGVLDALQRFHATAGGPAWLRNS